MKLWQASALIAGEDPDLICPPSLGSEYFPNEFPFPEVTQRFEKVLRIAASNVCDEEGPIFPKGDSRGGRAEKQNKDVVLADVVAFLMGCGAGINVPEQLQDLRQLATVGKQREWDKTNPRGLPTGDIAFCFAGLKWSEEEWKVKLGKMPKWLETCLDTPGERGKIIRLWNPVQIGVGLVKQGYASQRSVRARFQADNYARFLGPWFDAWQTYETEYLDED